MSIWVAARRALDAVLTPSCLLCGLDAGTAALCAPCAADLPLLPAAVCPVCALPTPDGSVCGTCLQWPPHFDATRAVYRYAFPVDRLIQALKYQRRLASADFLASALTTLATGHPQSMEHPPLERSTASRLPTATAPARPDLIVPVPLSAQRLVERGFNQAVELARPLARRLGATLVLTGVRRARNTVPQAGLPWQERAKNIRHAFECELDLSAKSVWIVDDVMTTGATLDELARTLRLHGAARIENRVVARTLRG